jgi:hypothetical protein
VNQDRRVPQPSLPTGLCYAPLVLRRLALVVASGLCACQDTSGTTPLPTDDVASYATYVQPILEARCATLDCHGEVDRPLRLYAETGLRARDALRDRALDPEELAANVRALAAVDPGATPEASLVISKPLLGGEAHEGGDLWLAADEPQVVCVRSWLAGSIDVGACTSAAAEPDVMLRDP